MSTPEAPEPFWKRVLKLTLWLHLLLPVGMWKLYNDPELSTSTKWRVFLYLFLLPWLAYVVVSFWSVNQAVQNLIP